MVISALTMSCPALLAGEAQGWKRKAKALPISWQSCHARGHSLCPELQLSVGQSWAKEEKLGCVGTEHLYKALREHLWKQNECKHPCLHGWIGSVWLGTGVWEARARCSRLCNHLPKFSGAQEMSFLLPVGCLWTDVHMTKPTCDLP